MFPTTVWTTIRQAGDDDVGALDDVARRYRQPVLEYVRARGFQGSDADDICQDVFVRVLRGRVLAKADRERGRFRSLLLSVTQHVILDRLRKRRETPVEDLDPPQRGHAGDAFDRAWAVHLLEQALQQLREQGSPYFEVLDGHLAGQPQDRNRLWIARRKLAAEIRRQVAYTCGSRAEFEAEMAYLAPFLRPRTARLADEPPPAG